MEGVIISTMIDPPSPLFPTILSSSFVRQTDEFCMGQTISQLRLSSSTALVLCLRPRLPPTPLDANGCVPAARMEVRENLADELVENGLAMVDRDMIDVETDGVMRLLQTELVEAEAHLEVLQATLNDKTSKRKYAESVLQVSLVIFLCVFFVYVFRDWAVLTPTVGRRVASGVWVVFASGLFWSVVRRFFFFTFILTLFISFLE